MQADLVAVACCSYNSPLASRLKIGWKSQHLIGTGKKALAHPAPAFFLKRHAL
jgi:hypothetical protein